jgi:hypothetical protein
VSYYVVDVEADGPSPARHSMVCFAAVKVSDLSKTFYGETAPISPVWDPESLSISGVTREQHLTFPEPLTTMYQFYDWVLENNTNSKPIFISDNPAFDWGWINFYFHKYLPVSGNPFGYSARRIGDLYCGMMGDSHAKWKHLRDTPADHNPLNDSIGNAEVLLKMKEMGLKIKF